MDQQSMKICHWQMRDLQEHGGQGMTGLWRILMIRRLGYIFMEAYSMPDKCSRITGLKSAFGGIVSTNR